MFWITAAAIHEAATIHEGGFPSSSIAAALWMAAAGKHEAAAIDDGDPPRESR